MSNTPRTSKIKHIRIGRLVFGLFPGFKIRVRVRRVSKISAIGIPFFPAAGIPEQKEEKTSKRS
jgi:hypothetical protein